MRSVLMVAAVALVAAILVPRYFMQLNAGHAGHPAPAMMAARPVAAPDRAPADPRSVVVLRNGRGHFQLDARVDGRRLTFMVDTGASVIALTADDAATLGIHPAVNEFSALVSTANGTVRAAPVDLDRVEIEDITMRDVAAMVLPDGALSNNLLGMSFLSRLHRWEFADGKLVLEQ
jgi:aspartyl protease family protein